MLLGQAPHGFQVAAVRLSVGALGVLDPHLDPLGQPRVRLPEFWSTAIECRRESLARDRDASIEDPTRASAVAS